VSEKFPANHEAKSPGDHGKDLFGEITKAYRDARFWKKLNNTNG